jgi:hypothetical protein
MEQIIELLDNPYSINERIDNKNIVLTDEIRYTLYSIIIQKNRQALLWWWTHRINYKFQLTEKDIRYTFLYQCLDGLYFLQLYKFFDVNINNFVIDSIKHNCLNTVKWCVYNKITIPINDDIINCIMGRGYTELVQYLFEIIIIDERLKFPEITKFTINKMLARGHIKTLQWLWGKRYYLNFPTSSLYIKVANTCLHSTSIQWLFERRKFFSFRFSKNIISTLLKNDYPIEIIKWWIDNKETLNLNFNLKKTKISPSIYNLFKNNIKLDYKYQKCKIDNCFICYEDDNDDGILLECGHNTHLKCLNNWLLIKNHCPICRKKINFETVILD